MAGALRAKSVGATVALAGVAALGVVAMLGIAAVVLGTQCPALAGGLGRCDAGLDPVATGSIEPKMYVTAKDDNVSTVVMTSVTAVAPPAPRDEAAAVPSANELIEATFALVAEVEQSRTMASTAAAAAQPAASVRPTADHPAPPPSIAVKPLKFSDPQATAAQGAAPIPAVRTASVRTAYAADAALDEESVTGASTAGAAASLTASDSVSVGEAPIDVRAGPSTSAAILFVLEPGGAVEVAERRDGWVRFILADGRGGWIDTRNPAKADGEAPGAQAAEAGKSSDEAASGGATPSDKRIVGGSGVNVRSGPSRSSSKLFTLAARQEVTVTGDDKGWLRVIDAKGRKGWIYKSYLTSPN